MCSGLIERRSELVFDAGSTVVYTKVPCCPKFSSFLGALLLLLCWGLTTRQPLWVILCRLPEKGRKEIEEKVEEMKERDRKERGTGMKVKKQKK